MTYSDPELDWFKIAVLDEVAKLAATGVTDTETIIQASITALLPSSVSTRSELRQQVRRALIRLIELGYLQDAENACDLI